MIETDRGSASGPLLETVLKDAPTASDKAMAEFLSGRREQELGQLEPALEEWVKVAAAGDRKARARALYARAMALYDSKQTSRLDTINALDALRFSWRGDAFEFTLLRQLGELQLAEGDVDGGIEALHEAAIYFADYPASKDVAKEAADSFANLYLGKTSDDVPPVKALALYTEFQDLEPGGDRHDQIVRKLIDRLVAVDLLDQATSLLDDQVKNHLSGHDKARGATQLALLRLMNRQPDAAIAALDVDVGNDIPADLVRQRQELRARALTDLNKVPDALALLQNDNSVDAARLRADIYWRQQDWKNAAKVFGELAGAPPAQGPTRHGSLAHPARLGRCADARRQSGRYRQAALRLGTGDCRHADRAGFQPHHRGRQCRRRRWRHGGRYRHARRGDRQSAELHGRLPQAPRQRRPQRRGELRPHCLLDLVFTSCPDLLRSSAP